MPNRVAHFEIHASDPERAVKFYSQIFGWEIKKWEGGQLEYWIVMTAPKDSSETGINGGIVRRHGPVPTTGQAVSAYVCTVVVDSFDAYAKKIEAAGGRVALPKMAIPSMAWLGYFIDSEGNIFGIHQEDKNAA